MDDLLALSFLVLLLGTLLLIFSGVLFVALVGLIVTGLVLAVPFVVGFVRGVRDERRN